MTIVDAEVRGGDLALPDSEQFKRDFAAITEFQKIVHSQMIPNHDYGIIPGTQKPTLLKPGAEKIAKLLGLADKYDIMNSAEDWKAPFFRYLVKCSLVSARTGGIVSEGLGECNSMEAKYRWRWVFESQLPSTGFSKDGAVTRTIHTKRGPAKQYRLENDDIYSQVNTLLKMAKKRALVDAALSAGRLSDLFTQDMEDLRESPPEAPEAAPAAQGEGGPPGSGGAPQDEETPPKAAASTPGPAVRATTPGGIPDFHNQLWAFKNWCMALRDAQGNRRFKTWNEALAAIGVADDALIGDLAEAAHRLWT